MVHFFTSACTILCLCTIKFTRVGGSHKISLANGVVTLLLCTAVCCSTMQRGSYFIFHVCWLCVYTAVLFGHPMNSGRQSTKTFISTFLWVGVGVGMGRCGAARLITLCVRSVFRARPMAATGALMRLPCEVLYITAVMAVAHRTTAEQIIEKWNIGVLPRLPKQNEIYTEFFVARGAVLRSRFEEMPASCGTSPRWPCVAHTLTRSRWGNFSIFQPGFLITSPPPSLSFSGILWNNRCGKDACTGGAGRRR